MQDESTHWTYEGAKLVAEYYELYEEDTNEQIEFDKVAIRCEWTEYSGAALLDTYSNYIPEMDEGDAQWTAEDLATELENHTTVLRDDGVDVYVVQGF